VVAIIVLAVVVFLIVDAFILYKVFTRHRSADDYGAIAVPGELGLLPAQGKLKLTYAESKRSASAEDDIYFGVPGALQVTVTAPSGQQLEIKPPGLAGTGSSISTGPGFSRALIGMAQVTETGEHTVSAKLNGELADAVEPRVLVGK